MTPLTLRGVRERVAVVVVVALMALGSLALWTAVPVAWLWFTREVEPGVTRYVVAVAGSAMTMVVGAAFLFRLQAAYARMTHVAGPPAGPPGWRRSVSDDRARRRLTLIEIFLIGSALIALLVLVGWWAFLSDSPSPSGPTAPGTEHGA